MKTVPDNAVLVLYALALWVILEKLLNFCSCLWRDAPGCGCSSLKLEVVSEVSPIV